jgi:ferredoxin
MKFISKTDLSDLLDGLGASSMLHAPCRVEGVLLYRPVRDSAAITWDFTRPALSVKEVFFPATERLLHIQKTGQEVHLTETLPEGPQVIFGVRPCDARGLKILDEMFLKDPVDPYYARRRENTTLIGLACREMGDTCFCTSVGGFPDDPQDMDVMLTETDGGYLVQIVTAKGQKLFVDRLKPDVGEVVIASTAASPSASRIPSPQSIDWPARFQDTYWERLADRCLSCRICGYVCPTCRCFIVRDEIVQGGNGRHEYERIRCWDTCTSPAYRRIAGGHNPRPAKSQRLRNRFMCKFYYYAEQYGPLACTGCGRCIEMCPVNIDITEVLSDLSEVHP